MTEIAPVPNHETFLVEALHMPEITTAAEAHEQLVNLLEAAKSGADPSKHGHQETEIAGVTVAFEDYYPPSHDYQRDELQINYGDDSSVVLKELLGISVISFNETVDGKIVTTKTSQSQALGDQTLGGSGLPRGLASKETDSEEQDARFVEQANEFKARLFKRAQSPQEYSPQSGSRFRLAKMAGRLARVGVKS